MCVCACLPLCMKDKNTDGLERGGHGAFQQHDIGINSLPTEHLLFSSKIKFLFTVKVLYERGSMKKKNHSHPHSSVICEGVKLHHRVISCLCSTLNLELPNIA